MAFSREKLRLNFSAISLRGWVTGSVFAALHLGTETKKEKCKGGRDCDHRKQNKNVFLLADHPQEQEQVHVLRRERK
jgi:hypothetical protein